MSHPLRLRLALIALAALCGTQARAGEAYAVFGFPLATVGYAQPLNSHFGLRADVGATGTFHKDGEESGIDFQGSFTHNRLGFFADLFPFEGRFRFTGGLTVNQTNLKLRSRFDGVTPVTINGKVIVPPSDDYFNVDVTMPKVTPYLGIGWGHQMRASGLGFVADIGASFGRAKLKVDTNVVGQYGITQADVDAETQDLRDNVGKIRVIPQLSLGLSYQF